MLVTQEKSPRFCFIFVVENRMDLNTKAKLIKYIEKNQIASVLNNTKWERLLEELRKIDGCLDFQRKDLDEPEPEIDRWDGDLYHVLGEWQQIEWLNIRALVSESKGILLKPVVTDHIHLLIEALTKAGIPFEMHNDGVRIWGYLRPGVNPKWVNT